MSTRTARRQQTTNTSSPQNQKENHYHWGRGSGEGSEGSGEGLGGFGAEPGQVQQGSGEGSREGSERLWCTPRSGSTGSGRFRRRSGRLWCRARSGSTGFWRRFQRRFWKALVHTQVRFNRVPKKVPEKVWEALVQSEFNRVPEKVPEKVPGGSGQVQQGSREGSPTRFRRLWCRARSGSTGFREGSGKGREGFGAEPGFNRVPEKVPEKVPGSLGAKPSQAQRVPEKVAEKVPEKVLGIFGEGPGQVQQGSHGWLSERFVNMKRCGCWGYHRSLFFRFRCLIFSGEALPQIW